MWQTANASSGLVGLPLACRSAVTSRRLAHMNGTAMARWVAGSQTG